MQLQGGDYVDNQWVAFGLIVSTSGGFGSRLLFVCLIRPTLEIMTAMVILT